MTRRTVILALAVDIELRSPSSVAPFVVESLLLPGIKKLIEESSDCTLRDVYVRMAPPLELLARIDERADQLAKQALCLADDAKECLKSGGLK